MSEHNRQRRRLAFSLAMLLSSAFMPASLLAAPPQRERHGDNRRPSSGRDRPRPPSNSGHNSRRPERPSHFDGRHNRPPPQKPRAGWHVRKPDHDRPRYNTYRHHYGPPPFGPGRYIPYGHRHYLRPAPPHIIRRMGRIRSGFVLGYYQGFTVVYDPETFFVLSIDAMAWD